MAVSDVLYLSRLRKRQGTSPRQIATVLAGVALVAAADPRPTTFWIGAAITALGWALRIWSFGHLRKNEELITSGPYAYTRHPAYLGSLVCLIGVGLAAGNAETGRGQFVWTFLAVLIAVFFGFYLPRKFERETNRLLEYFGEPMRIWSANVPRFLPRLSPWPGADQRRFRLAQVTENHEWPWGMVFVLAFVGMATVDRWSPF